MTRGVWNTMSIFMMNYLINIEMMMMMTMTAPPPSVRLSAGRHASGADPQSAVAAGRPTGPSLRSCSRCWTLRGAKFLWRETCSYVTVNSIHVFPPVSVLTCGPVRRWRSARAGPAAPGVQWRYCCSPPVPAPAGRTGRTRCYRVCRRRPHWWRTPCDSGRTPPGESGVKPASDWVKLGSNGV